MFFNSFKSNSRDVAIFFNNNCEFEIHSDYKDENGNYLILDATVENMHPLLINIYGPNSDTPNFYASLMDKIVDCLNTQYIIIGGNFIDWKNRLKKYLKSVINEKRNNKYNVYIINMLHISSDM